MPTPLPFGEIVNGKPPDTTLISPEATPRTVVEHRGEIATAIGFPEERYSSAFQRPVVERLYVITTRKAPSAAMNIGEIREGIAKAIGFPDADSFNYHNQGFNKEHLQRLIQELKTRTYGEVEEIMVHLDVCPVCDRPVGGRKQIAEKGPLPATTTDVCLHTMDNTITVIEHRKIG